MVFQYLLDYFYILFGKLIVLMLMIY